MPIWLFLRSQLSVCSYKTKPISIQTTRWDPVSGGASATLGTAIDLGDCITGIVTRPIGQHQKQQRQKARAVVLEQFVQEQQQSLDSAKSGAASTHSDMTGKSHQSTTSRRRPGKQNTGLASVRSIGMFGPKALKGMTSDIPLAITEGMKSIPGHYGDKVRDHGQVTGIGSGFAVAGKTFAWGFADGLSGLVTQPYKDVKKNGAAGLATGLGKGLTGLVTKTGAGMFGTLAYPATGIAKSIKSAAHRQTRKEIETQRWVEGIWLAHVQPLETDKKKRLIEATSAR